MITESEAIKVFDNAIGDVCAVLGYKCGIFFQLSSGSVKGRFPVVSIHRDKYSKEREFLGKIHIVDIKLMPGYNDYCSFPENESDMCNIAVYSLYFGICSSERILKKDKEQFVNNQVRYQNGVEVMDAISSAMCSDIT